MDETSKAMLKRDVFVQGLLLKWQKKVLPTASTFSEALHQSRAAEEQERQLLQIRLPAKHHHFRPGREDRPDWIPDPKPSNEPKDGKPKPSPQPQRGPNSKGRCFECQVNLS